jgi:transposase
MFHGVETLNLQYKGTQGYLKTIEKEQKIEWIRTQIYLILSDLQKYLKKQYDVVFDQLQSYYNLLR